MFFSSAVLAILPVVKQCIDFFTNSLKKKTYGDPGTNLVKNH